MRARSSQRQCGAERREQQRGAGGGVCEVSSQGTSSILGGCSFKGVQLGGLFAGRGSIEREGER